MQRARSPIDHNLIVFRLSLLLKRKCSIICQVLKQWPWLHLSRSWSVTASYGAWPTHPHGIIMNVILFLLYLISNNFVFIINCTRFSWVVNSSMKQCCRRNYYFHEWNLFQRRLRTSAVRKSPLSLVLIKFIYWPLINYIWFIDQHITHSEQIKSKCIFIYLNNKGSWQGGLNRLINKNDSPRKIAPDFTLWRIM